jgi:hypothetical protein
MKLFATEYFKVAELSLAAKDRLLDVGGTLAGGVVGGVTAGSMLPYLDGDAGPMERGLAVGAGTLVGSGIGKTVALHSFGHQAPQTLGEAVLGLPPAHVEKKYEKLAPTSFASKFAGVEPSDLKHGTDPDSKFDPKELAKGMEIEREHSDDPAVRKAITKAHLHETKDYNTRLLKMEAAAEKAACWATEYFGLVS